MIETQAQRDKRTKVEKEVRAKRAKRYENDMKRWAKKQEVVDPTPQML
jgi:hypothetical protein